MFAEGVSPHFIHQVAHLTHQPLVLLLKLDRNTQLTLSHLYQPIYAYVNVVQQEHRISEHFRCSTKRQFRWLFVWQYTEVIVFYWCLDIFSSVCLEFFFFWTDRQTDEKMSVCLSGFFFFFFFFLDGQTDGRKNVRLSVRNFFFFFWRTDGRKNV